jgi:hypothetical protein
VTPRDTARPTRFFRLVDGRPAQLTALLPIVPVGDHVEVTIAPLDGSAEVDTLLPERWMELRDGELRRLIAAAIARRGTTRIGGA